MPSIPRSTAALGAALILGLLASFLFDGTGLGINVMLFAVALAACALTLAAPRTTASRAALVAALCVAWCAVPAWRDSVPLRLLALAAVALTLYLAYLRSAVGPLATVGLSRLLATVPIAVRALLAGGGRLVREDVDWAAPSGENVAALRATGRGLILCVPLLAIFGSLLVSADVRFGSLALQLVDWELASVLRHVIVFVAGAALSASLLRVTVLARRHESAALRFPRPRLGGAEVAVVLTALNLLFVSYVAVQASYFFGGDALVRAPGAPTYADYARQGFFELVVLAALVVPLLILAMWLSRGAGRLLLAINRWLAATMIALVVLMELSAGHRMALYTSAYGLTELRLYTSAFMVWLLALFALLAMTVVRGRRTWLTLGAAGSALALVVALVVTNPDATIARVNMERAAAGARLDVPYLMSLGDDAVPTIAERVSSLPAAERTSVHVQLDRRRVELERELAERSWASWSWSRARALAAIEAALGPWPTAR